MMNIICTLYEGKYGEGVIALVNSLIQAEFEGGIYVGTRGTHSPLVRRVRDAVNENDSDIEISLLSVDPETHLARFKPFFMSHVLDEVPEAQHMFYADPDLVFKAGWRNFVQWAGFGVSLCEDQNSPVYDQHPIRHVWRSVADNHGFKWRRSLDTYFNSGYIGLDTSYTRFLDLWQQMIEICENYGDLDGRFDRRDLEPLDPFQSWDQDALNIAACCYDGELSFIGKEGMDFEWGGRWMSHAVGARKPWNASYVVDAFQGRSPRQVDRLYWRRYQEPYPTVDSFTLRKKRLSLNLAVFISRFVGS